MRKLWLAAGCLVFAAYGQEFPAPEDSQLTAYVEEALNKNPAVQASFARYRAALQKAPQARTLPDPMLQVAPYLRSPETRVGPQSFSVSLSQKLPWFGKLDAQANVALKEAHVQERLYQAARADVVRRVKLAYYDLAFVDEALGIAESEIGLLTHFERLARARYAQGAGLQQAAIKLQAEITRLQAQLEQLRAARVDAEAALNSLLDQPPARPLPRALLGPRPALAIGPEELAREIQRGNPDLRAAFERVEKAEKQIDAARKEYWPDFTIGLGYVNVTGRNDAPGRLVPPPDNGKDIWGVSVGVNIPIRRRGRDAAVLEATENLVAARHAYREEQNSAESAVRTLTFRLDTLRNQIELFEGTLLPQARQALRSAEAAYSTGEAGVLDLLDSQRMSLEIRLGLARMETDYRKAVAELERVTGPAPKGPDYSVLKREARSGQSGLSRKWAEGDWLVCPRARTAAWTDVPVPIRRMRAHRADSPNPFSFLSYRPARAPTTGNLGRLSDAMEKES